MSGPIKYIELQNWVSYEKGRFDFHPNVNMIIGPSGKGKSAMMAAFFKLFYNRPMGEEFVSWWGGETKLITAADDWVLEYHKKKKKAFYNLAVDDDTTQFTAFGSTVPDDISRLLRISDELNIQKQFTKKAPIFLLSETPGDAAKKLNTFANLTGIDETIQAGRSDIQESKREVKGLENQLDSKEKELNDYLGLDELEILIDQAENKKDLIKDCSDKIDAMEKSLERIQDLKKDLDELIKWNKISKSIKKLPKALEIQNTFSDQIEQIEKSLFTINELRNKWADLSKFFKLTPLLEKCDMALKQLGDYDSKLRKIDRLILKIKSRRKASKELGAEKKRLRKDLTQNFPEICPLCKGKVDKALL